MIIGVDRLLDLVQEGRIVRGLADRELNCPEGAGFDLRVAEVYDVSGPGFLGVTERESSRVEKIAPVSGAVSLQPNRFYLAKIAEEISLEPGMLGIFHPRTTLFRCGVVMQSGVIVNGYSGAPTFGLHVAGQHPFELEIGARIAHINIFEVKGKTKPYRGQWNEGRVATAGREKQV